MKFNLQDYEPVDARIKSFYTDHPSGCILTELKSDPDPLAVFMATIMVDGIIRSTGWAVEMRDMEMSKSRSGKEYETVNFSSWLENCETSAIGRALANFNYAGSKRASREEMAKVSRVTEKEPVPDRQPVINAIGEAVTTWSAEDKDSVRNAIKISKSLADLEQLRDNCLQRNKDAQDEAVKMAEAEAELKTVETKPGDPTEPDLF